MEGASDIRPVLCVLKQEIAREAGRAARDRLCDADIQDVVQTCLLASWRFLLRSRGERPPHRWVATVLKRELARRATEGKRRHELAASCCELAMAREERFDVDLMDDCARLAPRDREILRLMLQGFSQRGVARRLSVDRSAVRAGVGRIRIALARHAASEENGRPSRPGSGS